MKKPTSKKNLLRMLNFPFHMMAVSAICYAFASSILPDNYIEGDGVNIFYYIKAGGIIGLKISFAITIIACRRVLTEIVEKLKD